MTKIYLNYPNKQITFHHDPQCSEVQKMRKPSQRIIRIDLSSFPSEIQKFQNNIYSFAAQPATNDMWLEIDFFDQQFERLIFEYIRRLLGNKYAPFFMAHPKNHC